MIQRPSKLASNSNLPERPQLRAVEPHWVEHEGQPRLYLHDPLSMSETTIVVPEDIAQAVALMDGQRTIGEIRAALALRAGITLTEANVADIVVQLDRALLIENGSFMAAVVEALDAYRSAEFRPPSHAGGVYPARPEELERTLNGYLGGVNISGHISQTGALVGMVCPHIDYERGHATYSALWKAAAPDLDDVELVVILGTDHSGSPGAVTLTRQNYATPYGMLPTDTQVVDRLASAMHETDVFGEEIHHATEHSIELAAVWLHHFTRSRKVQTVPVLCGSFAHVTSGDADPGDVGQLDEFLGVMGEVIAERRTLVVAAGDLAHVGPAFGDAAAVDAGARDTLGAADQKSIDAILAGDAEAFLDLSCQDADSRKICGLSAIYMMLRLLNGAHGEAFSYDQCQADAKNGSVVSILGTLLYHD